MLLDVVADLIQKMSASLVSLDVHNVMLSLFVEHSRVVYGVASKKYRGIAFLEITLCFDPKFGLMAYLGTVVLDAFFASDHANLTAVYPSLEQ